MLLVSAVYCLLLKNSSFEIWFNVDFFALPIFFFNKICNHRPLCTKHKNDFQDFIQVLTILLHNNYINSYKKHFTNQVLWVNFDLVLLKKMPRKCSNDCQRWRHWKQKDMTTVFFDSLKQLNRQE